ncbi:hypothetical protein JAAARDRAFT_210553 [Jaapia argillacea MUCL 33604]|uniref:REJ domain-containing protein n=1 Tax=Jaapia argillacea MUCL 33604 TaxID=933084 RepID=A0A067PPU3_9AGAM|nr:hypothetical protein JAAARDRAFT_210553 [Jaapia argillacea MUCL 33604]
MKFTNITYLILSLLIGFVAAQSSVLPPPPTSKPIPSGGPHTSGETTPGVSSTPTSVSSTGGASSITTVPGSSGTGTVSTVTGFSVSGSSTFKVTSTVSVPATPSPSTAGTSGSLGGGRVDGVLAVVAGAGILAALL